MCEGVSVAAAGSDPAATSAAAAAAAGSDPAATSAAAAAAAGSDPAATSAAAAAAAGSDPAEESKTSVMSMFRLATQSSFNDHALTVCLWIENEIANFAGRVNVCAPEGAPIEFGKQVTLYFYPSSDRIEVLFDLFRTCQAVKNHLSERNPDMVINYQEVTYRRDGVGHHLLKIR
jgi:hypothetical protein